MCLTSPILAAALASAMSCSAVDFELTAGFRGVLSSQIEDSGYRCARVLGVEEHGYERDGVTMRVTCGGDTVASGLSYFRVIALPDGEHLAYDWPEHRPAASRVAGRR